MEKDLKLSNLIRFQAEQIGIAKKALKKIAEVSSVIDDKRNATYGDWELRIIARDALKELENVKNSFNL